MMHDDIERPPRPARIAFLFLVYAALALPWGIGVLASLSFTRDTSYLPYGIASSYDADAARFTDLGLVGVYLFCQVSVVRRAIQAIRNRPDDEDDLARTVAIGIVLSMVIGIAASLIAGSLGGD